MIVYNDQQRIDLVNAVSDASYVDNGEVVRHVNPSTVMIGSESDLTVLTDLVPTSVAYTAGFKSIWQKDVDGTWVEV